MTKKLLKAVINAMNSDVMVLQFSDDSVKTLELFYPDQYTAAINDGESFQKLTTQDKALVYDELKRFSICELNQAAQSQ